MYRETYGRRFGYDSQNNGQNGYANGYLSTNREPPRGRPTVRGFQDWSSWLELTVKIEGLPTSASTINVYDMLSTEGTISRIDMKVRQDGSRTGEAFVTFCPPPARAFWDLDNWQLQSEASRTPIHPLNVILQYRKSAFEHRSPVNPLITYPERMTLHPNTFDIGFMYQKDKMMVMESVESSDPDDLVMLVNLCRRELVFEFSVAIPDARLRFSRSQKDRIRLRISFHQLDTVLEIGARESDTTLVFMLDRPPVFHRKLHDIEQTFDDTNHWNERVAWARMTEIKPRDHERDETPLRLRKGNHVIDIGRWTTYRVNLTKNRQTTAVYDLIKRALNDYNIKFIHPGNFETIPRTDVTVWDCIDFPESARSRQEFLEQMSGDTRFLPWSVRYQLESCISQGCLNERNMTKEFVQRLESVPETEALSRLEAVVDQKKRVFEPMDIFTGPTTKTLTKKMPSHCVLQRSATVTPTCIYFGRPAVDMSNRVLRQYQEHADRFLRVRFTDEKLEGRIQSTADDTQDAVLTRVFNCLTWGIKIGDRHFEFLAMGNSQFREHGAYFFASTPTLRAADIRAKLGQIGRIRDNKFVPERVVAKFASRLGQCFSTTRPIRGVQMKIVETADVERNGYNFTDGVGKIPSFVAQMIASELNIRDSLSGPPSVFQFRMGGIKGVLAVCPEIKANEVHIRASQYKFAAIYEGLEIIRWSSYAVPRLNRQLIVVLQSLGIADDIFFKKLKSELLWLDSAMENEKIALKMLQEQVDFNQMTLTVSNIVLHGFMSANDPFALSILQLWRAWSMKQLREKAALTINDGAFLLGCTDETATLRGYFENSEPLFLLDSFMEERVRALPEIFVQVPDFSRKGHYRVIEDICIVARNPSLHPGDIRVVRAVDVPALHHLKDVVVFPQTGDRDIPGMCSGGDLDGDDFIVIWDKDLIPSSGHWDEQPMDFTPPKPHEVDEVTLNDLVSFFVTYIKTDTLGIIATAHLANADQLPGGVRHPVCLRLAAEHSTAVDYPKSGVPPNPIKDLRPFRYPHFMANRNRPKNKIYHSNTILGELYDQVPQGKFRPMLDLPFDARVLDAFQLDAEIINSASQVKAQYDAAMRRIMAQHDIKTEFEVWTTFVMDHAQNTKDYKFHEEIGHLSSGLKEQFTEVCYEKAGGRDYETLAPFVAAMYTITANEVAHARRRQDETARDLGLDEATEFEPEDFPLISFPWLFYRELGKIASGTHARPTGSAAAQQGVAKRHTRKAAKLIDLDGDENDKIETEEGFTHRGDLLELALKSPESETFADIQHAAMVDQNVEEANAGAAIKEEQFMNDTYTPRSSDCDEGEATEDALEEGEIQDSALQPDAMDGVETFVQAHSEQMNTLASSLNGLEVLSQDVEQFYDAAEQIDPAMTDDNNDDTGEQVMIDVDDERDPFDKLERVLCR